MLKLFPHDYNGAVIQCPVLNMVAKMLLDQRNTDYMLEKPQERWIGLETQNLLMQIVTEYYQELGLVKDGIIQEPFSPLVELAEIRKRLGAVLTEEQRNMLDMCSSPLDLPFPLANGYQRVPGYIPYRGEPLVDFLKDGMIIDDMTIDRTYYYFGYEPGAGNGEMSLSAKGVLGAAVLGSADADITHFDVKKHREKLLRALELLDATDPDLSEYLEGGGKLILLHGLADPLVTPLSTIEFYRSMKKTLGDKLDSCVRFYAVPGQGHQDGSLYWMGCDLLGAVDQWVTQDIAPGDLISFDQRPAPNAGVQVLKAYQCENGADL